MLGKYRKALSVRLVCLGNAKSNDRIVGHSIGLSESHSFDGQLSAPNKSRGLLLIFPLASLSFLLGIGIKAAF